MKELVMQPISRPFQAEFTPPGSKSLTNRALVLAAMATGVSELTNCLFADDTLVMIEALGRLGFRLEMHREEHRIIVHGRGGEIEAKEAELFCGNSGTSIRFLAALCSLGKGRYVLDGIPRMRQRPIGELTAMLRNLGVRVNSLMEPGFPPIEVLADGLPGGMVRFGEAKSSQFLSALLQVCPYARIEVKVNLEGRQTSWPYVAMTMQLMDAFGVTPELYRDPSTGEPKQVIVPMGRYEPTGYSVEPDASNASYFLALAALHAGSKLTLKGLGKQSLQGDVGFADVLHRMGAGLVFGRDFMTIIGPERLEGIEVDLRDMPDTAQTLAVCALFAEGETVIRGLHTLRHKETDRLQALKNELEKFQAEVEIDEEDSLIIRPPERLRHATVATYDDHRMAMSFALAGTRIEHVAIQDPQCVNKTYPGYFDDLRRVTGG